MRIDWAKAVRSRPFRVDLAVGLVLAAISLVPWGFDFVRPHVITAILALAAIALRRVTPSGALAVAWVMAAFEIGLGERPSPIAVAYVVVLYATARLGSRYVVMVGAGSAVAGGAVASYYLAVTGARFTELLYGSLVQSVLTAVAPVALLGSAWLVGLAVRFFSGRADESSLRLVAETEAHRALDVAAEERARAAMARDVHDIVGHSLAVIIAQADSIEFLDDTDRIRAVGQTIAQTARSSLGEVRDVLSGTSSRGDDSEPQDLGALVEQVRAAGVVVEHSLRGERRTLDPALSIVVRRVAQEMLTNALRHGTPGRPIDFRETWRSGDVVLEVENEVPQDPAASAAIASPAVPGSTATPTPTPASAPAPVSTAGGGLGVAGMRARVTAVGGFLEAEALDGVFTARARIPLPRTDPLDIFTPEEP
ncbi:sensor histidine kinase [Frondihabitans australicus]|uniref:histidine kinase n=1 Tax=Frondihabitans australicus TaxID=386892 RepID=A0A495IJB9_9MICO|nr:histidine kinase [Frondihabitans australicus]RKR75225.1 signal transduction histidine kinase [Frondihabitans australicus]